MGLICFIQSYIVLSNILQNIIKLKILISIVTIFKGLGVGTQHLVFNIALRVEVVERTRHKEDLIQLNVLISLSQSH